MGRDPRANAIRERIEDDGVALGVLDNTYSPTLVEFYGDLGLDFVWLDFEHAGPSPMDAPAIEGLLRAADVADIEVLARLPTNDPAGVRKALDAGVRSLFLPRVEGPEEVRAAVRAAHFEYGDEAGHRGLAGPRARRWGLAEDYVATEDESVLVGVTIETAAAIESIDEILEVPELGFVFLGPLDLSVSLGHPGEIDHPEVQEAIETARTAALEADVTVGGLGFGMEDVNQKVTDGYQILHLGSTTGALKPAVEGWLADFEGERPDGE